MNYLLMLVKISTYNVLMDKGLKPSSSPSLPSGLEGVPDTTEWRVESVLFQMTVCPAPTASIFGLNDSPPLEAPIRMVTGCPERL